jgi:hypothetical protein
MGVSLLIDRTKLYSAIGRESKQAAEAREKKQREDQIETTYRDNMTQAAATAVKELWQISRRGTADSQAVTDYSESDNPTLRAAYNKAVQATTTACDAPGWRCLRDDLPFSRIAAQASALIDNNPNWPYVTASPQVSKDFVSPLNQGTNRFR